MYIRNTMKTKIAEFLKNLLAVILTTLVLYLLMTEAAPIEDFLRDK
jgi:hypothetical protein